MKSSVSVVLVVLLSLVFAVPAAAQDAPGIHATFENVPQDGVLELAVGESYTFVVHVSTSEPFQMAQLGLDQYYPGRSVFADGIQAIRRTDNGTLTLTVTGKRSTAQLPDGVAPVSLGVGVRYKGGVVVTDYAEFAIRVH